MSADRCPATNRQGEPCGHPAGFGTDHPGVGLCKFHAGSTQNGRLNAVRLEAEARAAKLKLGETVPIGAAAALEWAVELVHSEAVLIQQTVQEWEERERSGRSMEGINKVALARALSQAGERLAKVAKIALDADLDGKRLALDALVLDRIDGAIRGAIADAGLGAEETERLHEALGRRLHGLAEEDAHPSAEDSARGLPA